MDSQSQSVISQSHESMIATQTGKNELIHCNRLATKKNLYKVIFPLMSLLVLCHSADPSEENEMSSGFITSFPKYLRYLCILISS